jgi:hypothetical protein
MDEDIPGNQLVTTIVVKKVGELNEARPVVQVGDRGLPVARETGGLRVEK